MSHLKMHSVAVKAFGFLSAVVFMAIATPAMATTQQVPSGQSLVVIPCEEGQSTLYKLGPSLGDATPIGENHIAANVCYSSAQFNPISKELVTYNEADNNWQPHSLIRVDPSSGEILGNINLVIDEWDDFPDAGIVPLSGDSYYMIDSITYDALGNLYVFLEDHKMYYAVPTQDANTFELRFLIDTPRYALTSASDPTEPGSIYALFEDNDYDIENNHFYKFSITYSGGTPQSATMSSAITSECRYSCFAMAIDKDGVAWLYNDRVDGDLGMNSGLYTTNFENSNPVYTYQVEWDYYTFAFVPTAALTASDSGLAHTGADAGLLMELGLFILATGFVSLVVLRLRRKTVM